MMAWCMGVMSTVGKEGGGGETVAPPLVRHGGAGGGHNMGTHYWLLTNRKLLRIKSKPH